MITNLYINPTVPTPPPPGTVLTHPSEGEVVFYLVVQENSTARWNMPDPDRTRNHIKVVCLNGCRCGFIPANGIKDYNIVGHLDICTDADKGN